MTTAEITREAYTLSTLQGRIDDLQKTLNSVLEDSKRARLSLIHLVNHWDEYSQSRLRNEIVAITEEVLTSPNVR